MLVEWLTPELLKEGGNLIIILLGMVGLYRLAKRVTDSWLTQFDRISNQFDKISARFDQLADDHAEISASLRRLNGKE